MIKHILAIFGIILFLVFGAFLVANFKVAQLALLAFIWIALFSAEYALNGGTLWRCFKEDLSLYGINGSQRRGEFAKKELSGIANTTISGSKRMWRSEESHSYTEKDYIDCGNDILGRGYYFWISKFIIPITIAYNIIAL